MTQAPDDYAFKFMYADKSAFQIHADGRCYIVAADGTIRDEPRGTVINRIPRLIEEAREQTYYDAIQE